MGTITPGSVVLTDRNATNANLPANVLLNTSQARFTVPVTWSGYLELKSIQAIVLVYSDQVSDFNLQGSVTYQVGSAEAPSGSHSFVIDASTLDDFGWSSDYGTFSVSVVFNFRDSEGNPVEYGEHETDALAFSKYLYAVPVISSFIVARCNSDGSTNAAGTAAKVTVGFIVNPIGTNNTKSLSLNYRTVGADGWTNVVLDINVLGYTGTKVDYVIPDMTFAQVQSYEMQAVLKDQLNSPVTSLKILEAAGALLHLAANKTQIAFGKFCEDGGPEMDIDKQTWIRDTTFFLAHVMPYCKLSAPTSESMTYNANKYLWVFDFKTVERNDDSIFSFLLGGSGGARQMGFIIPRSGKYRAILQVRLTGGSSSGLVGYIAKFASTWTPPTVNYQGEDTMVASAIAANIGFLTAFSATNSWIQITYDFDAVEGEKVWPTAYARDASKTIDTANTWASIQQIG